MTDVNISQDDADILILMEKMKADPKAYHFPEPGFSISIPLISLDKREDFLLDITRSSIRLTKVTFQERARNVIPLIRLDLDGSPHRNPDNTILLGSHIHLYREGYGDKWAFPIPERFRDTYDLKRTLLDFFDYCNIIEHPVIQWGLFS